MAIEARACLCVEKLTLEEAKAKYSTVVLATVLEAAPEKEGTQSVTLESIAFWKGKAEKKLVVRGGGVCGYTFRKGEVNLIFANLDKPGAGVSGCSRSTQYHGAVTSIQALGIPETEFSPVLPSSNNGLQIKLLPSSWRRFDSGSLVLEFINDSDQPIRLPTWKRLARGLNVVSTKGKSNWPLVQELVPKNEPSRTLLKKQSIRVELIGWKSRESLRPNYVRPLSHIFREPGEFESLLTLSVIPDSLAPGEWSGHLVSNSAQLRIQEAP